MTTITLFSCILFGILGHARLVTSQDGWVEKSTFFEKNAFNESIDMNEVLIDPSQVTTEIVNNSDSIMKRNVSNYYLTAGANQSISIRIMPGPNTTSDTKISMVVMSNINKVRVAPCKTVMGSTEASIMCTAPSICPHMRPILFNNSDNSVFRTRFVNEDNRILEELTPVQLVYYDDPQFTNWTQVITTSDDSLVEIRGSNFQPDTNIRIMVRFSSENGEVTKKCRNPSVTSELSKVCCHLKDSADLQNDQTGQIIYMAGTAEYTVGTTTFRRSDEVSIDTINTTTESNEV